VPALSVVPPEKVFAQERVSVPPPIFDRVMPVPETTPLRTSVPPVA